MNTVALGYTIIEDDPSRISAVNDAGVEICGAYKPAGHDYWSLYLTKLVTGLTGAATPPHREHFYGSQGRMVAHSWIEMLASLYSLAVRQETAAA